MMNAHSNCLRSVSVDHFIVAGLSKSSPESHPFSTVCQHEVSCVMVSLLTNSEAPTIVKRQYPCLVDLDITEGRHHDI